MALMRRGSLGVNIVTLSTSGGTHDMSGLYHVCDECFYQGRGGGDFEQNVFPGWKK